MSERPDAGCSTPDRRDSSCTTTSIESGGSRILKRELLMGVAEHCVADFISTQTDARKKLVNSIATNIYENLKNNTNISALLTEALSPATLDKESVLKSLMVSVSGTLRDSLNKPKDINPNRPDSLDSLQTSSSESPNSSFDKPLEVLDSETSSEFVYESCCKTESKQYVMSREVDRHQLPVTVAELEGIPLPVQELSKPVLSSTNSTKDSILSSTSSTKDSSFQDNNSRIENMPGRGSSGKPRSSKSESTNENENFNTASIQRTFSFSDKDRKLFSLPPRPSSSSSSLNTRLKGNQASGQANIQASKGQQGSPQPTNKANQGQLGNRQPTNKDSQATSQTGIEQQVKGQPILIANQANDKTSQGLNQATNNTSQGFNQATNNTSQGLNQATNKTSERLNQATNEASQRLNQATNNTSQGLNQATYDTSQGLNEATNETSQGSNEATNKTNQKVLSPNVQQEKNKEYKHEHNNILQNFQSSQENLDKSSRRKCKEVPKELVTLVDSVDRCAEYSDSIVHSPAHVSSSQGNISLTLNQTEENKVGSWGSNKLFSRSTGANPLIKNSFHSSINNQNSVKTEFNLLETFGSELEPQPRSESQLSIRSLSPLSVGPVPSPTLVEPGSYRQSQEPFIRPQSTEPVSFPQFKEPVIRPHSKEPVFSPQPKEPDTSPTSKESVTGPQSKEPVTGPQPKEPVTYPTSKEPVFSPQSTEPGSIPKFKEPATSPQLKESVTHPKSKVPDLTPQFKEPVTSPQSKEPVIISKFKEPVYCPKFKEPVSSPIFRRQIAKLSSESIQTEFKEAVCNLQLVEPVPIPPAAELIDKSEAIKPVPSLTHGFRNTEETFNQSNQTINTGIRTDKANFLKENSLSFSEFSESLSTSILERTSTMSNEENISAVHIQNIDVPRMNESESVTVPSEYMEKVENFGLSCPEEKAALGQIRHEHIQRTDPFDRLTQAQSTEHKETGKNCFDKNKDFCQPESQLPESQLPPLEDPSVILLSPTPIRRSMSAKLLASPNPDKSYEDDYTDLESLAEEVHHVKEDKARVFINSKLKDSISDMVAYQKHINEEQKPKTHFELLKESQMKAQKEFHARLFKELAAENQRGKKSSKVAEVLGTKFSSKTQENVSIYDQEHSGFKSAPSKSPNMSRRGSNSMDTWMSKSPFWSQSLPRPRRKVTFVDDSPQRPPPPPPERQQSINTMRSMSGISTVYNQTLIEESHSQAHYYQTGSDSGHQKISSRHQQTGSEHQQTGSGHQPTGSGNQQTGSENHQNKPWNQQTSSRTQETSSGSVQFENTNPSKGNQNLEQEIHRQELEREELKLKEFQRQESERQELERKALERKELERKEMERKEFERQELEKQEINRQELQKQELQKQEMQKQELHKKELQKLELIKQEQEFKKQELQTQDFQKGHYSSSQKQQQFSHFDQTQSQQKHQYQIQSQQEHQHQNQSQKEHQYQKQSQQEYQYQNQSHQQLQHQYHSQQEHPYQNQSQHQHQYQNQSQQEHQHQYQTLQYNQHKSHSPRQSHQYVEKNDGNALKSVEYREFYKGRIERRTPEQEYKLDLGDKKDRWMELYGNSVLNNTIQDRSGSRLHRSQSAVWNSNQEIVEHSPVMSTDKLEKPKHPPQPTQQQQGNNNNQASSFSHHFTNSTLPRKFSRIKVYDKGGEGLKRNASMSDVSRFNYEVGFNGGPLHNSSSSNDLKSVPTKLDPVSRNQLQVPPYIVKSIVISVLEKQGVPNPSDDIINRAIQEYYNKNPEGVFVGSASDGVLKPGDRILAINNNNTSNLSHVDANNLFKRSGTSARLEIGRSDPNIINTHQTDMSFQNHPDLQKVHSQAKNVLSSHLKTLIHSSEETSGRDSNHDVALQNQPYRTLPLVLPNPKTIHDCVGSEKNYCTSSLERNPENQPYRTASLVMPGPKTINEIGAGAPTYKPYRGPQYTVNNQHKFGATQSGQYNSPEHLYNEESLAKTPRINQGVLHLPTPGNATNSKQHESETFKIVLESEMDGTKTQHGIVGRNFEKLNHGGERPTSQLSDRSYRTDPVLNNTSINQSASFKKLMHSVLGESEF